MRYTKKPITKIVCPDGSEHETLTDAQTHDIFALLSLQNAVVAESDKQEFADTAAFLVSHASEILDILLTDGRSRKRIKTSAKPRKKSNHEKAGELLDEAARKTQITSEPKKTS